MDLQMLIFIFPAGVVLCFRELRDEHVFVIIYALVSSYFAGVMVRLMLTLTPVVCVSAAVALSTLLDTFLNAEEPEETKEEASAAASADDSKKKDDTPSPASTLLDVVRGKGSKSKGVVRGFDTRFPVILNAIGMLSFFVLHCTWVTSSAYSSPSVVLASSNPDGSQHIIDDYREAYYWLRMNTPEDAVVMSWWDYGYQIAGFADRPTLVDNNTWNNSKHSVEPIVSVY